MPRDTKEPQSYGSEADWVSGRTGQQPNDPDAPPPATQREFYDERRESEDSAPNQGGQVSPEQLADQGSTAPSEGFRSPGPITETPSGARRGSYFKDRDYPA